MKQKLEDLKLLIMNDKRILAATGFIVAVIFIWAITSQGGGSRRARMSPEAAKPSEQGMGTAEGYGDLIMAFKNDIETGKKDRQELFDVVQRTTQDLKEHKERVTGIFETLVDKFDALAREVDSLASSLKATTEATPPPPEKVIEGPDELASFGVEETVAPPPPPEPAPTRVSVIAPGDNVAVELITGVNAPVDGTPYPVVFKLVGPVMGPDGSTLDLGEARLIAAAQGSESDSRALYRLTQLSMRHPNGRRAVVEVDGWVVGEDGIRGMTGKLIDKLGRLIIATAAISGTAALGDSMDDSNNYYYSNGGSGPFNLSSQQWESAAASALTDASNRLGEVLLNRYESLIPVVEVLQGREVQAIFSKPAEISIIEDYSEDAGSDFGGIE